MDRNNAACTASRVAAGTGNGRASLAESCLGASGNAAAVVAGAGSGLTGCPNSKVGIRVRRLI